MKIKALTAAVLIGGMTLAPSAFAGLSGNVGLVSDYFFRGLDQESSATASAGLDYDFDNGLAVGVWGADVGEGIEYDLYGSYSGEVSGFSYSVGGTGYYYTNEFDGTYLEANLGLGYGPISLEYSAGSWEDTTDAGTAPDADYTFTAITAEHKGFYLTLGSFGDDFEGSYSEIGYGAEVSGFDLGVAIIMNDEDLSNAADTDGDGLGEPDTSMVFSLTKSFDM